MMEIYAGFLTHADAQIGRVLAALDALGERENTIVVLVSDNGASGEAGPHGSVSEFRFAQGRDEDFELNLRHHRRARRSPHLQPLPVGLGRSRQHTGPAVQALHVRGRRPGPVHHLVAPRVSTEAGAIRHQYCHAVDVLPTLLDLAGVDPPTVDRRGARR